LLPLDADSEQLLDDIFEYGGYVKVEAYYLPNGEEIWRRVEDPTGFIQMHHCDHLKFVLVIYIPQADELMSRSGGFEIDINAIQYNKEAQYDTYFPYNNS